MFHLMLRKLSQPTCDLIAKDLEEDGFNQTGETVAALRQAMLMVTTNMYPRIIGVGKLLEAQTDAAASEIVGDLNAANVKPN